jgi:4-amino-4-deoxy-L-arabinose transferase-like glycosyltransferase
MDRHSRSFALSVFILILFCAFVYFKDLEIPFYSHGEPREAVVIQEIVHSGEWILPRRNGIELPAKPPLFHWLGAIVSRIANGVNEFTVRFPSALMASLGVLLTFLAGCRLWGLKAGLFSALILGTGFEWWRAATAARVDMTFTVFTVAALLIFFDAYEFGPWRRRHTYIFFSACALAVLTKGPVGVILPVLTVVVFLLLKRDLAFWKKMHLVEGALLILILAGSWYGLALWKGGEAFFIKQILKENLLRFLGEGGTPHQQPFYYLVPYPFLSMLPWSLFFLPLGVFFYRQRGQLAEKKLLFPLVWVATVLCFFSLSSGKRSVYLLPLYPALSLLLGAWWQSLVESKIPSARLDQKTLRLSGNLCIVFFFLFMALIVFRLSGSGYLGYLRPYLATEPANLIVFTGEVRTLLATLSLWLMVIGGMTLFLMIVLNKSRWDRVFAALAIFTTINLLVIAGVFYPLRAQEHTFKPFMEKVRLEVGRQNPLLFYRAFDYGALFYAERNVPPAPPDIPVSQSSVFMLMWEEEWIRLSASEANKISMIALSDGADAEGLRRLALIRIPEFFP